VRGCVRGAFAVAVLTLFSAPAHAESLQVQVNRAIDRGVVSIRRSLGPDGAGTTDDHADYPEGDTALLLYTLLKSGVPSDDPQVRRAAEWLRGKRPAKTYSAALVVLALDALRDPAFEGQIRSTAEWIESRINPGERRWGYPDGETDLSNTQFAALALWTAERHGVKPNAEVWSSVLFGTLENQKESGAFAYRDYHDETGAMTVAGMTIVALALPRLPEKGHERRIAGLRKRADEAMERAWTWLDARFTAEGNPHGPHGLHHDWIEYWLYGVERLAAIAKRDRIGGKDWYDAGARRLVALQGDDGSWRSPRDTCFALLFLRRATLTSMDDKSRPNAGGDGVVLVKKPEKPRNEVRWFRRWLVLGPVPDPEDVLFDAPPLPLGPLAPVAGATSDRWKWSVVTSRQRWNDLPERGREVERSCCFAFTYLQASVDTDVVLWFGNDDGLKVFLDGAVVFDHHFHGGDEWDTNAVPVRLTKGTHRLLVQLENWGGRSCFALRIAHADGTKCPEIRPSLVANGTDLEDAARAQPGFFDLAELRTLLPKDPRLDLSFASDDHLDRLALDADGWGYPQWVARPEDAGDYRPSSGATGLLGMHPEGGDLPATAYWRVALPARPSRVRVRATCAARSPGAADSLLRVGVYDGSLKWALSEVVGPFKSPGPANWKWFEADLGAWAGKDVLLLFQAASGGAHGWHAEDLWIDQIEIR
jgi:hypothetical protein